MKEHFCNRCFQTLHPNQNGAVQCSECGKSYHSFHWENSCINCGSKTSRPFKPPSISPPYAVVRKPIRRRYRAISDNKNISTGEILGIWGRRMASALQWLIFAFFGFFFATLVGTYTPRLVRYQEFSTAASYADSLIRDSVPSPDTWIAASIAAAMGTFVFFPSLLRDVNGFATFLRRVVRFIAILILLFYLNIISFGINLEDVTNLLTGKMPPAFFKTTRSTVLLVQLGALLTTWLLGFASRRIRIHPSPSQLPGWLKSVIDILRICWHLLATLLVVILSTFFAILLLPARVHHPISIEIASHPVTLDAIHLVSLFVVLVVVLLFFHPPLRCKIKYTLWPLRILGCLGCFAGLVFLFRATPGTMTEPILSVILLSFIVALSLIPLYRSLS